MYPQRTSGGRPMPRKLRRRIVRQIETALANIEAALAGGAFRSEDERHASLAMVRMAPSLFRTAAASAPDEPRRMLRRDGRPWTDAESRDFIESSRALRHTRDQCPQVFAELFRELGPNPGHYETLEEAQAYGVRLWDQLKAKYGVTPNAEPALEEGSAS